MKIAVTGASGFVGRMLVPLIEADGHTVKVFGRDKTKLAALFPNNETANYDDMSNDLSGLDILVHLAVLNNNKNYSDIEFNKVNVNLAVQVALSAAKIPIKEFIYISSIHAIQRDSKSTYALSKKTAALEISEALSTFQTTNVKIVYLPLVFGDSWAGQLGFLNSIKRPLALALFRPMAALKPTVEVSKIAEFIRNPSKFKTYADQKSVILAENVDDNFYFSLFNRFCDFIAILLIIVGLGWFMVAIWIMVKLDSPGPGIFAQKRVGRNGEIFTCYKFRSMKLGTLQLGTHELADTQVTRFGKFLRRNKIDELPQVLNLLKREMTLIGPRPCLPTQNELILERDRQGVFDILPGITGLSQVQKIDMSQPIRLADSDATYLKTRSILLNLKIMLATIRGKGNGDKTRRDRL